MQRGKKKNRLKRERGLGHVTYFKFWDSLTSLERLKIQSSNVARGMKVRATKSNKMLSYRRETALQGAL